MEIDSVSVLWMVVGTFLTILSVMYIKLYQREKKKHERLVVENAKLSARLASVEKNE